MKAGVASSLVVHAAALAWGMVSLASPPPLKPPEEQSITGEYIDFSDFTKTVQGDEKAEPETKPAPKQTKKVEQVPEAQNAGETKIDKPSEAEEITKAPPVEKTVAPAVVPQPKPKPKPKPEVKPEPAPKPKAEPKPEPKEKTDIALLVEKNKTKQESETEEETFQKLPDKVPAPKVRPRPKKADKKKADDAKKKAVVNKAKSTAGGAKASKKKTGRGVKKSKNDGKLAQTEIDALRGRLEGCWSVGDLTGHPDADKMRARVTFNLTKSGEIDGRVKVRVSGTDRSTKATLAVRVRAAVSECAPYKLPLEKYDTWSEVVVNFSLADML